MEMMRDMESQSIARLLSTWCYRESSCILQSRIFDYGNIFNKIQIFIFFHVCCDGKSTVKVFWYKVAYSIMNNCAVSE